MLKLIKKVLIIFLLVLLIGVTCLGEFPIPLTEAIIADHDAVYNFDKIPDKYLDIVKTMLVVIPGESHGTAYLYGLELLEAMNSKYSVKTIWSLKPGSKLEKSTNGSLVVSRPYISNTVTLSWASDGGEEDFWTNPNAITMMKAFLTYQKNNGNPVSAFGFGWCYDMSKIETGVLLGEPDPEYGVHWYGRSQAGPNGSLPWGIDKEDNVLTGNSVNLDTYINAVKEYNACESGTFTFFTTGPVDDGHSDSINGTEAGYQKYLKHMAIRNHVLNNGGFLFDYADILCWDENGKECMEKWNSYQFPRIAPAYAMTPTNGISSGYGKAGGEHDANNDGFDDDYGILLQGGCHISREGCIRLGKAMWWMLAKMAGWDGNTQEPDLAGPEVVSVGISSATTVNIIFNEPLDEVTATNISNYNIASPILVFKAELSGTMVTLTTSEHQSGTYSITIANIKDKAANIMNTAIKSYSYKGGDDKTPPLDVIQVNDGLGPDISFTNSTTSLSANWSASSDPESGIIKYWYAIGTSPGRTDLLDWTDNGNNLQVTVTGLSLVENRAYYISVKAENGVGLQSLNWKSSNGQRIDVTKPVIGNIQVTNLTAAGAAISWITDEPATSNFEYGLTTDCGSTVNGSINPATEHTVVLTGLKPGTGYHYLISTIDLAGNTNVSEDSFFTTLPGPNDNGLVAYWNFDKDNETTIFDSSGNNHDGKLDHPIQWVPGQSGSGVLLNYNNVDFINLSSTDFGLTNELTISAWVKINGDTGSPQVLIKRGQYSYPYSIALWYNCKGFYIQSCIRTTGSTSPVYVCSDVTKFPIEIGKWYHVVMTYKSGALVIYLNGEVVDSKNAVGSLTFDSSSHETYIGAAPGRAGNPPTYYFNGVVDEFRIYNRALSADEVALLYNIPSE